MIALFFNFVLMFSPFFFFGWKKYRWIRGGSLGQNLLGTACGALLLAMANFITGMPILFSRTRSNDWEIGCFAAGVALACYCIVWMFDWLSQWFSRQGK